MPEPDVSRSRIQGYEIVLAPCQGASRRGLWTLRVYDGTGQHIHSAEEASLYVAFAEAERAVRDDQQERAAA
jgi:hypothetical protein